jgi:putative membrane protein
MSDKKEWLKRSPNSALAGKLRMVAWVVSAAVLILVVAMRKISFDLPEGVSFSFLPPVYSVLNAIVAVVLVAAVVFVKQGKIALHRAAITLAMVLSLVFLLGYVAYHVTTEPTLYEGQGLSRAVYFFFLITHVVLAAVSFPFILFAYISGFTNQFEKHRKMVRWIYPIWLYVAVTGPICYLMLRPYYGG